jgi:hypothetical protein
MTKIAGLAQRVISSASLSWIDGYDLRMKMTTGIVDGPAGGTDADQWLRDAHITMSWTHTDHRAYAVFDPERRRYRR